MNIKKNSDELKENLKSGVTVALVSIPLSIAISIASGAGPVPGIITGFWATMVAALFGGSKYNVVGPAGALTSILFAVSVNATLIASGLYAANILSVVALFSGVIIFVVYFFGLQKYVEYIPESVVHGFAAGVAVTIASTQLREAFGIASTFKPKGEFIADFTKILQNVHSTYLPTFIVFIAFFIFLLLWKKNIKNIPGVIPATILGAILGFFAVGVDGLSQILTVGQKYGEFNLQLVNFFDFNILKTVFADASLFLIISKTAFVVAIISILETLITAKLADAITGSKFDHKKETIGLSFANLASGLFGGLPATGVFIRTGLNVKSGATSSYSSLICGFVTGVGAAFMMPVFKYVPMSVIAAILMMTAIGLIDVKHFKHLKEVSKFDFYLAIFTAAVVVLFDPGIAVVLATAIALFWKRKK